MDERRNNLLKEIVEVYIKTAKPPNLEPNKIPDSKTNKNCKVK